MAETVKKETKKAETVKKETIDKAVFVKFLDDLEEGLAHYAGRRTERLRREFVTDLTELIQTTRGSL